MSDTEITQIREALDHNAKRIMSSCMALSLAMDMKQPNNQHQALDDVWQKLSEGIVNRQVLLDRLDRRKATLDVEEKINEILHSTEMFANGKVAGNA